MNPGYIQYTPDEGFSDQSGFDIDCELPQLLESNWNGSEDSGDFRIQKTKISPGFSIWITDWLIHRDIHLSVENHQPVVTFNFLLSGKSVSRHGTQRKSIEISAGEQGLFYLPDPNGIGYFHAGQVLRQVGIEISPKRLLSYCGSDPGSMIPGLCNIMGGKENDLFCNIQIITPAMRMALQQLLNCPFAGVTRKLFLESRALELITYCMEQRSTRIMQGPNSVKLHPDDVERVHLAEEVLIRNIENPPSLLSLARHVGINRNKLTRDFRQVFGTSVFEHLRILRLERARELLENNQRSVTEAAFEVGYSHQRNFSRAFKNHFGTNPREHLPR